MAVRWSKLWLTRASSILPFQAKYADSSMPLDFCGLPRCPVHFCLIAFKFTNAETCASKHFSKHHFASEITILWFLPLLSAFLVTFRFNAPAVSSSVPLRVTGQAPNSGPAGWAAIRSRAPRGVTCDEMTRCNDPTDVRRLCWCICFGKCWHVDVFCFWFL